MPTPLLASAAEWQRQMSELSGGTITKRGAGRLYLRLLQSMLSGLVLACDFAAPLPQAASCMMKMRGGTGAPSSKMLRTSTSMAGLGRMNSIVQLIERVAARKVPGSYLEAGVWRGGMSILATAALQHFGLGERPVYLCDSFAGLPYPRKGSLGSGETYYARHLNRTLAVGEQRVLDNFDRYSVPRQRVTTVPGYFVHSLPGLREKLLARGEKLAILRMDGDIYDSTADILYNLCAPTAAMPCDAMRGCGWRNGVMPDAYTRVARFLAQVRPALRGRLPRDRRLRLDLRRVGAGHPARPRQPDGARSLWCQARASPRSLSPHPTPSRRPLWHPDGRMAQHANARCSYTVCLTSASPRRHALLDFRAIHGIEDEQHTMINIDGTGAYFQKAREVPVQRARYLDALKTANYKPLLPPKMCAARACRRYLRPSRPHSQTRRLRPIPLKAWSPLASQLHNQRL